MTLTQEQLEWIVSEVVRRLRGELAAAPSQDASLTVSERLVTLATLRGRIDGIRSVRVTKSAVVTPAVHDELRKHGIDLLRD